MTNSEICAAVREVDFECILGDAPVVDAPFTDADLKRLCASYERLLGAAKGVEQQVWGEEDCAMVALKAAIEEAER